MQVRFTVLDAGGGLVAHPGGTFSAMSLANNQGITVRHKLKGGQRYTLRVEHRAQFTPYTLTVGQQKPTVDITENSAVSDSIEFTGQQNNYTFTPAMEGAYRFEFSDVYAQVKLNLYIRDAGDGVVASKYNVVDGGGLTTSKLIAGQKYTVQVEQLAGETPYTLHIGHQKTTVEVGDHTVITDTITFTGQQNNYTFVPAMDGIHRFEVDELQAQKAVSMYILDEGGGTVTYNTAVSNGGGISTDKLEAGRSYTLQVRHNMGDSPYTLHIGRPKPPIPIAPGESLRDSMQYKDQVNRYTFTAGEATPVFITENAPGDAEVALNIRDAGGGSIAASSKALFDEVFVNLGGGRLEVNRADDVGRFR
jgi:predicted outer membrane repeat protein